MDGNVHIDYNGKHPLMTHFVVHGPQVLDGDRLSQLDRDLADQLLSEQQQDGQQGPADVLVVHQESSEQALATTSGSSVPPLPRSGSRGTLGSLAPEHSSNAPGSSRPVAGSPARHTGGDGSVSTSGRPSTAPLPPRPATAGGGKASRLFSDELLNDHPLLLEYLVKHVLAEGLAAVNLVGFETSCDHQSAQVWGWWCMPGATKAGWDSRTAIGSGC